MTSPFKEENALKKKKKLKDIFMPMRLVSLAGPSLLSGEDSSTQDEVFLLFV